jgi:hypothetical protein
MALLSYNSDGENREFFFLSSCYQLLRWYGIRSAQKVTGYHYNDSQEYEPLICDSSSRIEIPPMLEFVSHSRIAVTLGGCVSLEPDRIN